MGGQRIMGAVINTWGGGGGGGSNPSACKLYIHTIHILFQNLDCLKWSISFTGDAYLIIDIYIYITSIWQSVNINNVKECSIQE